MPVIFRRLIKPFGLRHTTPDFAKLVSAVRGAEEREQGFRLDVLAVFVREPLLRFGFVLAGSLFLAGVADAQFAPNYVPPPHQLSAARLVVVVNEDSDLSVKLGAYYQRARGVPDKNMIRVRIPNYSKTLSPAAFADLAREIDEKLRPDIDAVLMVWTAPYAVDCNSITYAVAFGFDPDICQGACGKSKLSPLFDGGPQRVVSGKRKIRLAMLLPTISFDLGKELIDRGVVSDGSMPEGSAYFLTTSDPVRNSRAEQYPRTQQLSAPHLALKTVRAEFIRDKSDVMFYFIGAAKVEHLFSLKFLPGAVGDHLTSYGGDLLGDYQMSSLKWIEAGATASYGTVSEPCNAWQKFPNPTVLLRHYLAGDTVIEAYWKSVALPAQGLFIGEPLAAPYRH
jgi:uncharacterized protein (TIGR03790 family)